MRIDINGVVCEMPPAVQAKLLDYIQTDLEARYQRDVDGAMKALAKAFTRKMLMDLEKKARKAAGEEAAARFRPPRRSDPNLFLAQIMRDFGEEALRHVCLYISLSEDGETYVVSDLAAGRIIEDQGQAGRQVVSAGNDGIREDYLLSTACDQSVEAVPASAVLHP